MMEDNLQRRVQILEEKMEMALKQLREHDQSIQSMPGIPKSEEWWAEQFRIGDEKRRQREEALAAKQDCIPHIEQTVGEAIAPPQPKREMEISCGGPQPAKRIFHQEVLDELMRIVRDETGQLIAEHNVVQVLTDLLKKLRSIERQYVTVQSFIRSLSEKHE